MNNHYDFQDQLSLGKKGEEIVYRHLRSKKNVVQVKDLSEQSNWQVM
jgi:hypothetical protein